MTSRAISPQVRNWQLGRRQPCSIQNQSSQVAALSKDQSLIKLNPHDPQCERYIMRETYERFMLIPSLGVTSGLEHQTTDLMELQKTREAVEVLNRWQNRRQYE